MAGTFKPIKNPNASSIGSIPSLLQTLEITQSELDLARDHTQPSRYSEKRLSKPSGGERLVYRPSGLIRKVQRRVNKRIFKAKGLIDWPEFLYGSVPNHTNSSGATVSRDYIQCAAAHAPCLSALKLDISSFFDNISCELARSVFRDALHFPDDVSQALTDVCTHGGRLPQGALTSSYIAMLCLWDKEAAVVARLTRKRLVYTRLVDDITVSSKESDYDFSFASGIITEMLHSKDLPVNHEKAEVIRSSSKPILVHGLRVNYKEPRLPSIEVGRIRAAVHTVEGLAREENYRTSFSYRRDWARCMGRVTKLKRIGHHQHRVLARRLKKIKPLPSLHDIRRAQKLLTRLQKDWKTKRHTYGYFKRYSILSDRINLISQRFEDDAKSLRNDARLIRPEYE